MRKSWNGSVKFSAARHVSDDCQLSAADEELREPPSQSIDHLLLSLNITSVMVRKVGELYLCEECELLYKELSWAEKCEAWCKKNNACNLAITKHSVKT